MEDALEPPVLSTGQRTPIARVPLAQQSGRDVVATVPAGRGLCAADNVGMAH